MISALETAAQMIKLSMNGYFIAGLQGIVMGLVLGIEFIVIIEILTNGNNSRILNLIKKFKKSSEVKA